MKTSILIWMILIFGVFSAHSQFSFSENARYARWEGSVIDRNSNALPGTSARLKFGIGSKHGEASLKNSVLEDGRSYKVLFTHPKWSKNGTIKGWFPKIENLSKNSILRGKVGFVKPVGKAGTDGARFMVYLHYYVNGREQWKPIINIYKRYTGQLKSFSYDLSAYAGQKVFFELRVDAGKSSGQDWAAWVHPKVTQLKRSGGFFGAVAANMRDTPKLIYPSEGKVFNHYPRKTMLKWKPVLSAIGYVVEIDCKHCCESGKWCTDVGKTYIKKKVNQTSYSFAWVGAQEGRWRITSVFPTRSGKRNRSSQWRTFRYTR